MALLRTTAISVALTLGTAASLAAGLWAWAKLMPAPPLMEAVPYAQAVFDANGELLHLKPASDGQYRLPVRLDRVSPEALNAVVRYEDRWFWSHPGVNPFSVLRAAWQSTTGARPIGASTITMQVARLEGDLQTRTWAGKLKQMLMALRYEAHYEKRRILETYLTLAPYGANVVGIEAASLVWFGHSAERLTPVEAAALAVVPQNPVKRRPDMANPEFEAQRRRVGEMLLEEGVIDARWAEALRLPLRVRRTTDLPFLAPHYTRLVESLAPEGVIEGTLRLGLQQDVERLLAAHVERLRAWGIKNGAAVVLDTRTGGLVAHAGSKDFFDSDISGEVDAFTAFRSPGSALKPFIYGLALDQGLIHSHTVLLDRPKSFAGYAPENADGTFRGPLSAEDALLSSRNVPAVELERELSPDLYDLLKRIGVPLNDDRRHYGLTLALGGAEVRMADLVRLYGALATDGLVKPVELGHVRSADATPAPDRSVLWGDPKRIPVLSPESAFVVSAMLADRGDTVRNRRNGRVHLRWKTGTSNGFRDAWAAGLVGPYVLVVWLGNFDGASNPWLRGAETAVPLFRDIGGLLARDLPAEPLRLTEASVPKGLNVTRESVCRATGDVGQPLCRDRVSAWFIPGVSPVRDRGVLKEIWIDRATGLRACRFDPETTERRLWEFWPSEAAAAFRAAGIVKRPPPPWMPGCEPNASTDAKSSTGSDALSAPAILTPVAGLSYPANRFAGGAPVARLRLRASAPSGTGMLHWFDGARYLGESEPERDLVADLAPGMHRLAVVDEAGRTASVTVRVLRRD